MTQPFGSVGSSFCRRSPWRWLPVVAGCAGGMLVGSARASAQEFAMTPHQFNSWLIQGNDTPRRRAQAQLRTELTMIDACCQLTPQQKAKLELAADADIARFEDQVEQLRREVVGKTYDQNQIGEIYQKIQPLGQRLRAGLFGSNSLFGKVLPHTLDEAQCERLDALRRAQRTRRYAANLRLYVLSLDQALGLSASQRQAVVDALVEQTRPPSVFGVYDQQYVAWQASQVSDKTWAQYLDPAQCKALADNLAQSKEWRQWLEQQGAVPVEN